ncbi:MAG: dTDP-glucose 4,6-dehydratase [Chlamydiae bacterium]|nr:dTDP-glucose 4,6-dehydratase [Chlamydiota bacterium]
MNRKIKNILVTGGAGFIGSAFIRKVIKDNVFFGNVVNFDLLTYAADLRHLAEVENDSRYRFVHGDICNEVLIADVCRDFDIDTIVHFAAESHVDRSIASPIDFCRTNVEGTLHLLEVIRKKPHIHIHHVSTDEVYGSLGPEGSFSETSNIFPNSPYAASKAASDHFVRAYVNTYGISATISHCSNNYGPCQNEEKFIPKMIKSLDEGKMLPIYGQGLNIRDWLYVEDHVEAIIEILLNGRRGETYDIGGGYEAPNIDIVHKIIDLFSQISGRNRSDLLNLVSFVPDRLGHDFRYSIDSSKIQKELGWVASHSFEEALTKTIHWYLSSNNLEYSKD